MDVEVRRGAGEDGAGGRIEPRTAGKYADEAGRVGANESDERGAGVAEGRGVDMGKRLMGAARAGARGSGGGKRLAEPGRGSPNSIVG